METPLPNGPGRARRIIGPPTAWEGFGLEGCWEYRGLLMAFALRDLRLRYRQTVLGIAWVLLQPLLAAGIFTFVFGKIAGFQSGKINYFVLSFAGLVGWTLFASTVTKANLVLLQNAGVITKIYFPRLLLPLSVTLSNLIDLCITLFVMLLLLLVYHVPLTTHIVMLPLWLLLLLMMALGGGLITSALSVQYRDVPYIVPVLLQFMIYASPVAYTLSSVPAGLRHYFAWNPLTAPLEACRWSLLGQGFLDVRALELTAVFAATLLVSGAWLFHRLESSFADVI